MADYPNDHEPERSLYIQAQRAQAQRKLYDEERVRFARSPRWELRNVKRALTSFAFMNTPRETARLAAVTDLLQEKKGSQ